ncbi:MAG: prolyl oligopeptidase family serine peptidase [Pirellulales bacterium]
MILALTRSIRLRICVQTAALMLICSGVGSAQDKTVEKEAPKKTVRETIFPSCEVFQVAGRDAFILKPQGSLKADQPWVFYAPTLSAYPDTHEQWMHEQFLAAGVAVAGIDVGEAYGSPASRETFERFYQELTEKRGFSRKPCLLGRSRGGLWVSSWAADHPERFAGLAGIYPVYDLRSYPGLDKAAPSYGLTKEQLEAKLDELNPISRAERLAAAKLPVHIIHGDEDKVVPLDVNSAALRAVYERSGHGDAIEVNVVQGQGHNFWPGFFRSQSLVDFVIARARAGAEQSARK